MNNNSIHHFLDLAKAGQDPTASRGEWVCHQIAAALHKLDDDLMLLDPDTAAGAAALVRAAAGPFSSMAEKHAVYQMIEEAGRKPTGKKPRR